MIYAVIRDKLVVAQKETEAKIFEIRQREEGRNEGVLQIKRSNR
jgi:hypothetical protein